MSGRLSPRTVPARPGSARDRTAPPAGSASLRTEPTSPYLIAAQSQAQAAALRRGAPSLPVCLGGPAAAQRQCDAAAGVLSVGLAAGLREGLHAGDVIVATEIRGRDGTYCCPSAPMLTTVLRRRGLTVHTGPVAITARPPAGTERAQLVAAGAWCMDGESAWPPAGAGMPVAAVRAIADSGTNALPRPLTLARQQAALRVLSQIAPDLQTWGHAVRTGSARQVLLAGPRSFCAGVVRAVDIVTHALAYRGAPVYVRKQIVHNVHVVADLQRRGAVFVDDLEDIPDGACVVFSAHGVSPAVRAAAGARGLEVIDATCPLVSKVHTEVRRFVDRGDTVIFIGHRGHEETVGTMGERPAATVLVQDVDDAQSVQVPDPRRVTYLVQTTLAADDVAAIIEILRRRFPRLRAPATEDICYATTNRQAALEAVAAEADLTLVIGSGNSSNSLRLVEKSRRLGTEAHLIDDAGDIDLAWLSGAATVALTAGASAPTILVDGVIEALRGLGPIEVHERAITTENIHFTLPKEVRAP